MGLPVAIVLMGQRVCMKILKKFLAVALVMLSVMLGLNGFNTVIWTMGTVQGSEIGVLIKLSSQLGLLMVWVAVFGLWRPTPSGSDQA